MQKNGFTQTAAGWELGLDAKVLFGNNQETLSPESEKTVEKLASDLLHVGLMKVNLDGHTDNYGDVGYNNDLSLRRANTVAAAFAHAGMPRANIHTRGLGQSQPVASNKTQEGRAQNRRVSVIIVVLAYNNPTRCSAALQLSVLRHASAICVVNVCPAMGRQRTLFSSILPSDAGTSA